MEKYHMYLTGITITIMSVYMCNKQIALLLNYQWIHNNDFEVYKYFTATTTNTYIGMYSYVLAICNTQELYSDIFSFQSSVHSL